MSGREQDNDSDAASNAVGQHRRSLSSLLRGTRRMPRQWLIDRCTGTSKYPPADSRPPHRICWVPFVVPWCPDILEQNCLCESVGRIGCVPPENPSARRVLLWTAFISNIAGLSLLAVSALAMAKNFDLLWNYSFTRVQIKLLEQVVVGSSNFIQPAEYTVGLRAVAFQGNVWDGQGTVSFDEFCRPQEDLAVQLFVGAQQQQDYDDVFDCDACQKISQRIVPSLFLSMLSYIPNFTTDILRMWSNYDVNCQKFLATTFSWISLATAIYTWVNYRRGCFESFNTEPIALDQEYQPVDPGSGDVYYIVAFVWEADLCQVCLATASLLKVIDIMCNCILPTPTITRDFLEQAEYERLYGTQTTVTGTGMAVADRDNEDEPQQESRSSLRSENECGTFLVPKDV